MKKQIHIALWLAMLLVAARTAYILYQRHAGEPVARPAAALDPDYYVTPKKLYPYDLKSAKQLTQQPEWAKVGYAYSYYTYNQAKRSVEFARPVGQLLPLEKLHIVDVITASAPELPDRQIMAVFEKGGQTYAFAIGTVNGGDYHFYSDDMLFIQDPHQLYNHWPADVWSAIDQHQARPGMNELQVGFALGLGIPHGSGDSGDKTVDYANGGKPLSITYRGGKVTAIQPAG